MPAERTHREGIIGRLRSLARQARTEIAQPLLRRPRQVQAAALCHRLCNGRPEVLLVTSRGTGRWILPKGWLMRGTDARGAAITEAWEEAGVRPGRAADRPVGSYVYPKVLRGGLPVEVETLVFPVEVRSLADRYPEAGQRQRRWVAPAEAAGMVAEPGLQRILRDFDATG